MNEEESTVFVSEGVLNQLHGANNFQRKKTIYAIRIKIVRSNQKNEKRKKIKIGNKREEYVWK